MSTATAIVSHCWSRLLWLCFGHQRCPCCRRFTRWGSIHWQSDTITTCTSCGYQLSRIVRPRPKCIPQKIPQKISRKG